MTDYIRVRLEPLPARIRAFCVEKDDWYTIVINELLEPSERLKAFVHEMSHIENDDFRSEADVDVIERLRHDRDLCTG